MLKEILREIGRIEKQNKDNKIRNNKNPEEGFITCIESFPKHSAKPLFKKGNKYEVILNHPQSIYIANDLGHKKMFRKNENIEKYNPIRAGMDISYNHPVEIFFDNEEISEIPVEKIPN